MTYENSFTINVNKELCFFAKRKQFWERHRKPNASHRLLATKCFKQCIVPVSFLVWREVGGGYQKELDIYFVETNTYQIMSSIFSLFLFVLSHTHTEERALESLCFFFVETRRRLLIHITYSFSCPLSHIERRGGGVLLNTVEDETHSQMPDEMMKSVNFEATYICCNISFNFCK